jgi:hypothetical protein
MIHNDIHRALVEISAEQGWNEESQIIHLCGYLTSISNPVPHFREYLQTCADEENADVEKDSAVCEFCGASCEYHTEVCLCPKCKMRSAANGDECPVCRNGTVEFVGNEVCCKGECGMVVGLY